MSRRFHRSNARIAAGLLSAMAVLATPAAGTGELVPLASLASAQYAGIYDEPVTLSDGRFEGAPFAPGGASRPTVTLIDRLVALGDLDGDPGQDAAVLLVESSGGSGSFVYLAAMSLAGGAARNLATARIGDRVQVRDLSIADERVSLDLVVAGDEDAAVFPTVKVRKTFRLEGGSLVESTSEDQGDLSLTDLDGTTWTLRATTGVGDGSPTDDGVSAVFEQSRITGYAGCNRYFADAVDEGGGEIAIGPIGSTRKVCPPPVLAREQALLAHLAGTNRFGFRFGDLILSGGGGALIFSPDSD